jgi:hypothetical protein
VVSCQECEKGTVSEFAPGREQKRVKKEEGEKEAKEEIAKPKKNAKKVAQTRFCRPPSARLII